MSDIDLRFYLSVLLRRLPYFFLVAVPVVMLVIVAAVLLPPTFRSSARILVEAPQISTELAPSTVQTNAVEQFDIIQQQIMTRENLLALARKFRLYDDPEAAKPPSDAEIVSDMHDRISFEQNVSAWSSGQGATIFSVGFDADNPQQAAGVVNALVAHILGSNERSRTESAEETTRFFRQEVATLGERLKASEAQILDFKNQHRDALPDDLEFHRSRQASFQERLFALSREEAELRTRRSMVIQQYDLEILPDSVSGLTNDERTLQDLQRNLSDQLTIFSPDSPYISALRARIAALRTKIEDAPVPAKMDSSQPKRRSGMMKLQLSDIDDRLQAISKERASTTADLAKLTTAIGATPANETALNALVRSRDDIQRQYSLSTARLAEASTGERVEARSKGARFTLVEPAVPPIKPVGPKRRKIVLAGTGAAFALGGGLVLLLELTNKTLRRPRDISDRLGITPLATIPYIRTPRERLVVGLMRGATIFVGAAVVAVILAAISYQALQLDEVGRSLSNRFHASSTARDAST